MFSLLGYLLIFTLTWLSPRWYLGCKRKNTWVKASQSYLKPSHLLGGLEYGKCNRRCAAAEFFLSLVSVLWPLLVYSDPLCYCRVAFSGSLSSPSRALTQIATSLYNEISSFAMGVPRMTTWLSLWCLCHTRIRVEARVQSWSLSERSPLNSASRPPFSMGSTT